MDVTPYVSTLLTLMLAGGILAALPGRRKVQSGGGGDSITVSTWNVLHRIHAINYNEAPVVVKPPRVAIKESDRISGICSVVTELLRDSDVVCLQEVSRALLRRLLETLPGNVSVHHNQVQRVPVLRATMEVDPDNSEHLVVIVRRPRKVVGIRRLTFAFDRDRGKGFLEVVLDDGTVVICTHLPYDQTHRPKQIESMRLSDDAFTILCGDMNSEEIGVRLNGMRRARFQSSGPWSHPGPKHNIDLILTNGFPAVARVTEAGHLSDHNPVTSTITKPVESQASLVTSTPDQ